MDEDNVFQRPKEPSEESLEERQASYLEDLTTLFDEEEADTGLGVWSESSDESSAKSGPQDWGNLAEATPKWREDVAVPTTGTAAVGADTATEITATEITESHSSLSDLSEGFSPVPGASVFSDPEPTEAFDLTAVERVDEVLSLNEPLAGPVTELTSVRNDMLQSSAAAHPTSPRTASTAGAVAVGVLLGGFVLLAVALGEKVTLALLTIVLLVASTEWFTAMRKARFMPPVLLGYAAVTALPIAAFWRGADGIVLVLVFALFGAGMFYVSGVIRDRPLMSLGVTMLGIAYVGLTGAFGGLLLAEPDGAQLALTAVILTVANDVGAFVVGRSAGRTPLSAASPNKTLEGFVGGAILTIAVALVVISVLEFGPFGDSQNRSDGVVLGIVVALVAPLADLFESSIKRDLGVKDMGTLLPGHGGLLDRIDALLFVLPATYFCGLMFGII
ncbi:MAG: phosphatidate cytidylyltransferase [bacterium]|nr:phosphatidate cytidylyltransferase [bacterium]